MTADLRQREAAVAPSGREIRVLPDRTIDQIDSALVLLRRECRNPQQMQCVEALRTLLQHFAI
jgi:hypothetical protein